MVVRRDLRAGDAEAIVALQERVYRAEHGVDERFAVSVAAAVRAAIERGWPVSSGAVWLLDREAGWATGACAGVSGGSVGRVDARAGSPGSLLGGSLALTVEPDGSGRVRWFVLAPELRGRGLGRALLAELVAQAREAGLPRLVLDTFSALRAAAHLYREAGFELRSQRETDHWGPAITYQRYELELGSE